MSHVLVVGGGLAGCTSALELAGNGLRVTLLEKTGRVGGKVRDYGCKATDRCMNCGLCLAGGLWDKVEADERIEIMLESDLVDLSGRKGAYRAVVRQGDRMHTLDGISYIVLAIGFREFSAISFGCLEFISGDNIIPGRRLEKLLSERSDHGLFPDAPARVAFVQCFGSRDSQEKALYCSRVCCGYSTRAARLLKHLYPQVEIAFFYMDLQGVCRGDYYRVLSDEGIEFIRCRPVKVKSGKPAAILYEEPGSGEIREREFDLVVLSEGIRPSEDAGRLAEICTLGQDSYGFLKNTGSPKIAGIYLAGCVSGPKSIEETYTESLTIAREIAGETV